MFPRKIRPDLELHLTVPEFAADIFRLVEANRAYLRQWLPWLDGNLSEADTRAHLEGLVEAHGKRGAVHCTIFHTGRVVGVAGYNAIDWGARIGTIGYWLEEASMGRGIMTASVLELLNIGFREQGLRKIEIRVATGNFPSRGIPIRLGFQEEGVVREAQNLYGTLVDHAVYGLSAERFAAAFPGLSPAGPTAGPTAGPAEK
jgi:ribosomal-protein-serine acetyltransferase